MNVGTPLSTWMACLISKFYDGVSVMLALLNFETLRLGTYELVPLGLVQGQFMLLLNGQAIWNR